MFGFPNKQPKGEKLVLKLDGMHCTSCSMNVDFTLEDLDGVQEAKTHYATQQSVVTFDPQKITREKIVATVTELGYIVVMTEGA